MKGEPGVLQQRIEPAPLKRRRVEALKGIGGGEHEEEKAARDHRLHAEHARLEAPGQAAAEKGHEGGKKAQNQHPQNERALMIAPHPGDLVQQRLFGMGVLHHREDAEIGQDEGLHQAREGKGDEKKLPERQRRGERDEPAVAAGGAPQRQDRAGKREAEGEREREMTEFRAHDRGPAVSGWPRSRIFS